MNVRIIALVACWSLISGDVLPAEEAAAPEADIPAVDEKPASAPVNADFLAPDGEDLLRRMTPREKDAVKNALLPHMQEQFEYLALGLAAILALMAASSVVLVLRYRALAVEALRLAQEMARTLREERARQSSTSDS